MYLDSKHVQEPFDTLNFFLIVHNKFLKMLQNIFLEI